MGRKKDGNGKDKPEPTEKELKAIRDAAAKAWEQKHPPEPDKDDDEES